jgi:hypothetical protein
MQILSKLIKRTSPYRTIASRLVLALTVFHPIHSLCAADVVLSSPSAFGPDYAQILATNCSDTSFSYVLQSSTNLLDWSSVTTNPVTTTLLPFVVSKPEAPCFYRMATIPRIPFPQFSMGILCRSNFNMNGKNCRVDSFDSSDSNYSSLGTATLSNSPIRIYDVSRAKAGGDVGVGAGIAGSLAAGSGSIYGHLQTGPGSQTNVIKMGPHGTVGDLTWGAFNEGIESNGTPQSWWLPNCRVILPDVPAPTFAGSALPAPDPLTGNTVLNGGTYISGSSSASSKLLITAPTTLWLTAGGNFGVTMASTNASLILYVGKATSSGDSLSLSGNGTMNAPGYARNLQIYGLPSCTSLAFAGNAAWNACVYAPSANMTGGGGGSNTQETQGSIVVKTLTLQGHWNFHYDESLKANGPAR